MAKPSGPICNLDCSYCFYLEKERLFPGTHDFRMSDSVLDSFVRQYIEAQDGPEIVFTWQGGEPTLVGIGFYERALDLQARYCPPGKRVLNCIQTNGVLVDDDWARFFARHDFLVGVSLDGPRKFHDVYRINRGGAPTFDAVMRAIGALRRHRVEFNTLTVVHRKNAPHPLEVYRFLRQQGSGHVQFIPVVERRPARGDLLTLARPPQLAEQDHAVTDWSVLPRDWGHFLCAVFDEWVRNDIGRVFVQLFEVQLGIQLGAPSTMCVFSETCGGALAVEHDGSVFSCDHYVYPEYRLGKLTEGALGDMVRSAAQSRFGANKRDTLPSDCIECDVRFACNGECPKHRFMTTSRGEPGLNYLCAGYKQFFRHATPMLSKMADLLRQGRPASDVMLELASGRNRPKDAFSTSRELGRNEKCPCGSGRKVKHCHGKLNA